MKLSTVFAPMLATPDHIAIAEQLGYERAWVFDTPHQSPDVWITLARAADKTERIGIGPGVLVPSLRHPMSAAAATATLASLAPGRVAVAFGTGFTGRRAMGQNALPWNAVAQYVSAYRRLLRGEIVEWEGAPIQMFNSADRLADAARDVPILLSAMGPKGETIAKSLEVDGLMSFGSTVPAMKDFAWSVIQVGGTVLEEGEDADSDRVKATAGPAWAISYHAAHDFQGGFAAVETMPGGKEWSEVIARTPEVERHLAIHDGHLMYLNEADDAAWKGGGKALLPDLTFSGDAGRLRDLIASYAEEGVTEVAILTSGPDIPHELETYWKALDGIQ
ncbi:MULTISPECIES: LLM class flavin-dependent oxidoreductase [unclassified Rhodococcus (in: high G+C Gram-positive bacteria)]|uniref:LLM class flavin-dependent oxidoreductase n=1 Tax=unclassified Rhodococcus (in: high G+C Gram-positive bacteria) TaxID=192944 RepID=UPI00163AAE72|nr:MULTISPECIES: LLM class flavin-dependent oxidoreductase [unclassified Rhodococcus (in: high G+C Gram-positive bacteria)]MBC2637926.1 LLM class flavin-dependent oxidoreductase [Rhodococcus sp. 3A]MBC2897327.1 LLM class flavin-dependent oxidoreductase [Rhodococcus sp. 4CII]